MQRVSFIPPRPTYQQLLSFEMPLKMPMKVTGWINLSASAKQTTGKMPRAVILLLNIASRSGAPRRKPRRSVMGFRQKPRTGLSDFVARFRLHRGQSLVRGFSHASLAKGAP